MAFSAGFSPHPKISYLGAAPTGAAQRGGVPGDRARRCAATPRPCGPRWTPRCPTDVAVLECVEAAEGTGSLADRIDTSGLADRAARRRRLAELAAGGGDVPRQRRRDRRQAHQERPPGHRRRGRRSTSASAAEEAGCAILHMVVRQLTPAVRPDDVLAALAAVADLRPPLPPRAVREAQGRLDDSGTVADPLGPDRAARTRCQEEHAAV